MMSRDQGTAPFEETELFQLLTQRIDRPKIINHIRKSAENFELLIQIAQQNFEPQSWRACWMLYHVTNHDFELKTHHIDQLMGVIGSKENGHQREILRVILTQKLNEDQEGEVYSFCEKAWENIGNSPSFRHTAFRGMIKVAKKYPELFDEIKVLLDDSYIDTLTPGVKSSIIKLANKYW